jgi:hypothetical protein
MPKLSLALAAVVVVAAALFTQSRIVRAQSATSIEYVRLTPYDVHTYIAPDRVQERFGYRACVAGINEWRCRDFQPTQSSADALRIALVTLGNEGWDLVSAVEEDPNFNTRGLTYLFKRQAR